MKKIALITGGTRGIGRALAIEMSKQGYLVIIIYLSSDGEALKLNNEYGIVTIKADVSNYTKMQSVITSIINDYGKIDVVINNAGIAPTQKLLIDASESEFDRVMGVNFKGVYNVCKNAIPYMLSGSGVIVNVSSVQGVRGGSCEVIYSASKSAVIGFTRALSEELENSEITIFSVAPTLTDTDMNAHLSIEDKLNFIKESGLTKIPTANDVAEKIIALIRGGKSSHGKNFEIY